MKSGTSTFEWAAQGAGFNTIAVRLNEAKILSPSHYKKSIGQLTHENLLGSGKWQTWTVEKILRCKTYTGDLVQGHTKELDAGGYKRKKTVVDALFLRTKNTYAAVIAQAKKEQVQHEEQIQRNQVVRELSAADGLTQRLADLLIDRVYVYPDRRVEISYKVKDIFSNVI